MRTTIRDIQKRKADGEPIVMVTAYDAMTARLSEAAGIDFLLVGDSLGVVVQGNETPIPVTLDHIIYHSQIVMRATQKALVVGDMPFMSYTISPEQALTNVARLVQESNVGAVKMEGGEYLAETIRRVVEVGIPVMGHIGLQPQSVNKVGGMRVQGRDLDTARRLLRDAQAVQDAGAFSIVLESVPAPLAQMITERLHIPTIGIGAGAQCDGQVQVFHDIFALFEGFVPRHTKHYVDVGKIIREGLETYAQEVRSRVFPAAENSFTMKDDVLTALRSNGTEDGAGH